MSDLRCDLVDAGHLIATGIDGIVGHGAVFEDVVRRLGLVIGRWGIDNGAETVHFPPVMSRAHLERNGYLRSFPQLAAVLHGFGCGVHGPFTTGSDGDLSTGLMMVPSACYPIYPMVAARGPLRAEGALFETCSWCFRREPSTDTPRLQSFRMHEYVKLGRGADVVAFREAWIEKAQALYASLQLPFRLDNANDAFFGRPGRLMASSQRERNLKIELLVPIMVGAKPTACCSFNYAEAHFTEAWQINMEDESTAHSGCVGFGMERTTLALFGHHGFQPERWPDGVRQLLYG
jgi:seryl-tRNA synthetase